MATFQINAAHVSRPRVVGAGNVVTVRPAAGATAIVEYTTGTMPDVQNNAATWLLWPKGNVTQSTSDQMMNAGFIRVTAIGGNVSYDIDEQASGSTVSSFRNDWQSAIGASGAPTLSGQFVVGGIVKAQMPPGVFANLQFTRTLKSAPYTKANIAGAVGTAVNSLSYMILSGDAPYGIGCDASAQVASSVNGDVYVPPVTSVPATALTLTGPTTVVQNVATTNYTVALSPNGGTVAAPVTVTPTPVTGVTFAPTSLSLTTASPSSNFTATASTTGTKSIAVTNNGGLTNPAAISLVVSAASSAPAVVTAAAINGAAQQGAPLSITAATFSGSPTPTVTRTIKMDGTTVASGNQSTTYTPVLADVGKLPSVSDTASNGVGSAATSTAAAPAVAAAGAVKNSGTMRLVGTQAQITSPSVVTFAGGMASRIVKIQAPAAAIGCRVSVHNLSPVMGVNYVKASVAPTDIAAVDTLANAYNAYANGVTHNVTASGADPLGFTKATWGGAAQSRRLEPSDAVLPSFGYNNQQDTVTSDPIMGLVPKRATDRANEEYYYLVRLTIGLVQNYDGLCVPVAGAVTGPIAEYNASNGADSVLWHGGDLGLVDGVDGAYTLPAAISAQQMPVMTVEWIYPTATPAYTFVHPGDSVTEGYGWPRIATTRKSTLNRPIHHVNLGGSTTRTGSFLGNMYLYLQSNAKPDYMVMPIISINNYSPLSDFTLSAAQAEMTRLQEVEAFLTGLGIKIIWWTPFNFGANPASSDVTSAWGYLYNNAKAYAATKNITFMDINGDPRMVRSIYNASTNPTGWIAPDNTHPSNPAGIQGFAAVYGDTLTALGF